MLSYSAEYAATVYFASRSENGGTLPPVVLVICDDGLWNVSYELKQQDERALGVVTKAQGLRFVET